MLDDYGDIPFNNCHSLQYTLIHHQLHNHKNNKMKKIAALLIITFVTTLSFGQTNYTDIVYLKNGDTIRGVISEEIPNEYLIIQSVDGNVLTYTYDQIEKLAKEPIEIKKQNSSENFENSAFGFKMEKPENWSLHRSVENNIETFTCTYVFFLPISSERLSEWDNSVIISASGNGLHHSLANVKLAEQNWLESKFDDLKIIQESDRHLLVKATINDNPFYISTWFNYQNGISYVANFSYRVDESLTDKSVVETFFNNITYHVPIVEYADLEKRIQDDPEDATSYFNKANRAFHFHQYDIALTDVNQALNLFPFYGEAYYLRGYVNIALGDTVAACEDFESSISEDYAGESELMDYCNTRRISEAREREKRNENNPFKEFDPNANHLDYVDSVRNHNYFILSFNGKPNQEIISYVSHLNHLYALDFKQLDRIFTSEKGVLQLFALGIIIRKFPEKITKEHKKILKSTGQILVLTGNYDELQTIEIKKLASNLFEIIKIKEDEKKIQTKTEKAVTSLILAFAKYPKSYESISFEEFHVMHIADGDTREIEKESIQPIIGHRYKIKNSEGKIVEVYNTFKFDYQFKINIIEGEESNTFSSYPPMVQEWLEQYGRTLSDKDKKRLGTL